MKCSTQNTKCQRKDASVSHCPGWSANESCNEGSPDQYQQDLSTHYAWPSSRNTCIWPREQQPHWGSCKGWHQHCPFLKNTGAVISLSTVFQDIHGHQGYLVGLLGVLHMMPIKNRLDSPRCEYLSEEKQYLLILWNCYLQCLSPPELWFIPRPTAPSQPFGGIYHQYGVPQHHHQPVFP